MDTNNDDCPLEQSPLNPRMASKLSSHGGKIAASEPPYSYTINYLEEALLERGLPPETTLDELLDYERGRGARESLRTSVLEGVLELVEGAKLNGECYEIGRSDFFTFIQAIEDEFERSEDV